MPGPRLAPPTRRSATASASPRSTRRATTLLFERFISARAQRAARHRRRLRAPAARGGHPVHLRQVRPRPRRARRGRHQLPAAQRAARRRQGARHRPAARSTRSPRASTGSTAARIARRAAARERLRSRRAGGAAVDRAHAAAASAFRATCRSTRRLRASRSDQLSRLVPVENAAMDDRSVIQWDKDDLDALGLLKVDVLALGMLSAIRRALDFIGASWRGTPLRDAGHPATRTRATYDMICRADTVGVFQIESRAQMSMLPRLKPRTLLRPGDRGRDRAAGADPGRHGASVPEAPRAGARSRSTIPSPSSSRRSSARWACRSSRSR